MNTKHQEKMGHLEVQENECVHEELTFLRCYEDFIDGDYDEIFECKQCKKKIVKYYGR